MKAKERDRKLRDRLAQLAGYKDHADALAHRGPDGVVLHKRKVPPCQQQQPER